MGKKHKKDKKTQRGFKISRRRSTENNILSISRKLRGTKTMNINDNDYKEEQEMEEIEMYRSDDLMLDLFAEITRIQKEYKLSKQTYSNKISDLEHELKSVRSENNLMQQTLTLYEHRIAQMERAMVTQKNGGNNNEFIAPIYNNNTYHTYSSYHTQHPPNTQIIDRYYTPNKYIIYNRPYSSRSSVTSSHSTTSSHSHSSSSKKEMPQKEEEKEINININDEENVYHALETKSYLKVLEDRRFELESRKSAILIRKKKSISSKKFEPIELEQNVVLNDWEQLEQAKNDKMNIDPKQIRFGLIIDESKEKEESLGLKSPIKHQSNPSNISILSGENMNKIKQDSEDDDIEIVLEEKEIDEEKQKEINDIIDEEKEEEELHKNHTNHILEALQECVAQKTKPSEKEQEIYSNTTSTTRSTSSASNVSSLFDTDSMEDDEGRISSDCFYLFGDDGNTEDSVVSNERNKKQKLKYTDSIKLKMQIGSIRIPRSEKDLLKKVKPAYKHHLEMIDDDGSITRQIQQRKKRNQIKKQQQQIKQLQHFQRKRAYKTKNKQYIKMCYFERKPLGFQINESPDSILVTNVYNDRGSAFQKGIEKGWKIIEVNKQCGVKGMMLMLRTNDGPFNITFNTNP